MGRRGGGAWGGRRVLALLRLIWRLVLISAPMGASLLINEIFIRVIRTNKTHVHIHTPTPTPPKPLAGETRSISSPDLLPACHSCRPHQVPSGLSLLATQQSLCCHRN